MGCLFSSVSSCTRASQTGIIRLGRVVCLGERTRARPLRFVVGQPSLALALALVIGSKLRSEVGV